MADLSPNSMRGRATRSPELWMAVAALVVYLRVQLRRLARWAKNMNETSRAVKLWAPGAGERIMAGPLGTRIISREHAQSSVLLLHGLGTSGDYYGQAWDELGRDSQLVVPDMLGFGRSRDTSLPARAFALAGHLDALDKMMAETVPESHELVLVGHSFGGLLALHLAARHVDRVRGVVLIATPFHDSYEAAEHHIVSRSRFNRYFTLDRYLAQGLCRFLVRYPTIGMRFARLMAPTLPREVVDQTLQQSWNAYVGSLRCLLADRGWRRDLKKLRVAGVDVHIVYGGDDHTVERDLYIHDGVRTTMFHDAAHQLPITEPHWCARIVSELLPAGESIIQPVVVDQPGA
ncbi:MAG: alpha/beta fold hydrolase [Thermoleophilia bacterium]|nr:alpha/beta fold hydrolase [Thermoleophilia bacterium]